MTGVQTCALPIFKGLGIMLAGVALLLATLYFYNTRFAEERGKKSR